MLPARSPEDNPHPPVMSCSPHPPAAYVEEYNEEAHTTLPETRQTANVAAKRSKPDIEKLKQAQGSREETSDSGHSTYTNAVGEPAGSSLKSKTDSHGESKGKSKVESQADSHHLRLDTSVAMSKRKSDSGRKSAMTPKSTLKSSLRRTDGKIRDGRSLLPNDCTCEECMTRLRSSQESSRSFDKYATQRTKPEAPAPPPPTKAPPSKPAKEVPVAQPIPARPRSASTQSYRGARPLSFHAGLMGEQVYIPSVYLDTRPMSTFPAGSMFQPPPYPPPKAHYYPPNVPTISQRPEPPPPPQFSYEPQPQPPQRQQTHHWSSELQPPPNQPIMYSSSPAVDYPQQMYYPARFPMSQSLPHRPVLQPPFNFVEQAPSHNEDWYRMPPPPPPRKSSEKHQRPTIRHAATAAHSTAHHEGRRIRVDDGQHVEYLERHSPRKTSPEKHERQRRPPVISRPSYSSATEKTLPQHPPLPTRIRLEPNSSSAASAAAKQRRRASYYGHETQHDLLQHVEAYQASQTPHISPYTPRLTSDSLKLIRKKTNHTSSSDAGSFVSGEGRAGSWDDLRSRRSLDRRSELKTRTVHPNGASTGDGEGVTLRFNASQNVNLDLTGDGVETRTISLRQSGESEGGMELSIGGLDRGGGSVSMGRERSWRGRSSYIDDPSRGRELEYARSIGRDGDREREKEKEREKKEKEKRSEREKEEEKEGDGNKEKERDRERRVGASRSRRSSRSGYTGRAV